MFSPKNSPYCCICLSEKFPVVLSFINWHKSNSYLAKLQSIIPEVEWEEDSKICIECSELVEKFVEFKKLCIKSSLKWNNLKIETSDNKVNSLNNINVNTASNDALLAFNSDETLVKHSSLLEQVQTDAFSDAEVAPSANSDFNESDDEPLQKLVQPKRKKRLGNRCNTCELAFSKKIELTKHKRTCLGRRSKNSATKKVIEKFFCVYNCQQSFPDQNECEKHQKTCLGLFSSKTKRAPNIDRSTHACGTCARRFTSEQVLTAHVSVCTGKTARPFDINDVRTKCPLCYRVYATKITFNIHFTTTHRDWDIQNTCQICLNVFPTAHELTAHVHTPEEVAAATQSPQLQQQQCDTCHEVFDSVQELGKHCFTAHDTVWVSDATCEVCLEVFPSDADAVHHYKDAHGIEEAMLIRPYLCWHCPARFSLLVFKTHVKYNFKRKLAAAARPKDVREASDVRYVCDDCRKLCLTRNELELHISKEHREKYNGCVLIQCRHCAVQKSSVRALYAHVRARHMPAVKLNADKPCLSCEVCDATFATLESVMEHSETQHNLEGSTVTVYACPHCPFRCVTLATFNTHIATYFEEKARFVCPTCGADFATKQGLGHHEDAVHKKLTHICETCGKIFQKKPYLKVHIRAHHPELLPPDKQFKCTNHCDKSFSSGTELQMHIDRINGVKNYACHACPRTFVRQVELNVHHRRVHSEDQTRKHECPECHQFFKDKGYMKLHMKKAHNLGSLKWIPRSQRPREHACHLCSKDFVQKRDLERHLDSHAGIKRYACQFCNAPYAKRENLKAHLRKHHNFVL